MFREAVKPWSRIVPLPDELLDWQVRPRRWTMDERNGSPHVVVRFRHQSGYDMLFGGLEPLR